VSEADSHLWSHHRLNSTFLEGYKATAQTDYPAQAPQHCGHTHLCCGTEQGAGACRDMRAAYVLTLVLCASYATAQRLDSLLLEREGWVQVRGQPHPRRGVLRHPHVAVC
jgi:hypothetical protein